jgi:hypothetical protein
VGTLHFYITNLQLWSPNKNMKKGESNEQNILFLYDIQYGSTIIFIAQREIDMMTVTKFRGCFKSPWVKKGSVPQLCIIRLSISLVQSYNIRISVSKECIMKTDNLTFTEQLYMSRPSLLNLHPFCKSGNKWTIFSCLHWYM